MAGGNYEGLAKIATVFAIIFGVSLGLCGATLAFGRVFETGGDAALPFAMLEGAGMAVGGVGLIVIGLGALFQFIASLISRDKDEPQ
jgi:hypothetical protein